MSRRCIIVLGMHRSGTSAMAGVLHLLGAEAGLSLLPAQEEVNPKGFWEHVEVVRLHNQLLLSLGSGWYDERPLPEGWLERPQTRQIQLELVEVLRKEFSGADLWVLKDPRLCRFLPLWERVLADLGVQPFYLLVMRDPVEVAASLARRDGLVEMKSYLLWLRYVLESERETRQQSRLVVSYESLLADWGAALAPLMEKHGLPLALSDADVVARVDDFLEPTLRHHAKQATSNSSAEALRRLAQETYQAILGGDVSQLDRLEDETAQEIERCMPWLNQVNALLGRVEACESKYAECCAAVRELEREVTRVKGSLSWRVTGPLRVLGNFMKRASNR